MPSRPCSSWAACTQRRQATAQGENWAGPNHRCLLLVPAPPQALMSNVGGAATMVGDPPALIIGEPRPWRPAAAACPAPHAAPCIPAQRGCTAALSESPSVGHAGLAALRCPRVLCSAALPSPEAALGASVAATATGPASCSCLDRLGPFCLSRCACPPAARPAPPRHRPVCLHRLCGLHHQHGAWRDHGLCRLHAPHPLPVPPHPGTAHPAVHRHAGRGGAASIIVCLSREGRLDP